MARGGRLRADPRVRALRHLAKEREDESHAYVEENKQRVIARTKQRVLLIWLYKTGLRDAEASQLRHGPAKG